MEFKYQLDERPPFAETVLFALQWFLVVVPFIIILGTIAAGIHYPDSPVLQLKYLQKVFLATGVTLLVQVLGGHRLPIIVGPAAVLLSGLVANQGDATSGAAYFSVAVCGLLITVLSSLGLLSRISVLFTPRVVGIVLLLIAFTILPTILNLILDGVSNPFGQLMFAIAMIMALMAGQRFLPDALKSTIVIWALILGSLAYYGLIAGALPRSQIVSQAAADGGLMAVTLSFDPVVVISFLFCFFALTANDLGSIQSTANLLGVRDVEKRTNAGLIVTGLGNILAGCLGVIGPVNYSLSSGVIIASGCASRFPVGTAALGMILLAFTPGIISIFSYIPAVVTGSLLFYTMCSQVAGGLMMLGKSFEASGMETGLLMGFSLMLGTLVAFLPSQVVADIPPLIRPLLTNGFVVGVTAALILEHLVYGKGGGSNYAKTD
ncbi:uracil-xanthine permease family protein [Sporomusa sp.]|uniref:uracil-xanthine permease family protein n=1 Tax=Sporomusa sp. TaxID=2078658 RepID=UPI002C48CF5F|nr:solute carrier family 23 protein [Sporomusa sp.]HWR42398.1 solute carrier family 23 protein [Sporomusa sp.]